MRNVLLAYGFNEKDCTILPFGNGLINNTWLLQTRAGKFILQKINHQVFKRPEDIAFNIDLIATYLQQQQPGYLFIAPLHTIDGKDMLFSDGEYFRIFPFAKDSHTIDVVERPGQAFEAARQFGQFTRLLAGLDATKLKTTLPQFHDLSLRYRQFEEALQDGNKERIARSGELIRYIQEQRCIVDEFEKGKQYFKLRVTHHDCKISNILFDHNDKGLCVIDLDTTMPGYFISDMGDMIRTYVCPVSEEEQDLSKIMIRTDIYNAIMEGYCSEMGEELSIEEKKYFHFAGQFMIYMQALRFLTDHLNNDIYYGSKYEGHNFVRAGNQAILLRQLLNFNPG